MSDSVDRVFAHALQTVRKVRKTGSSRPPPQDRLKLYGLYKQGMEGDVEGIMERPVGFGDEVRAEKEKWDAWNDQSGLSKTEAKRRYIAALIETLNKYTATTPEARELVSDLEFVWDQVKSNISTLSSHSSSTPTTSPAFKSAHHSSALIPMTTSSSYPDFVNGDSHPYLGVISPTPFDEQVVDNHGTPNNPWRHRVEQALAKMSTEVAALREQLETARVQQLKRRGRISDWILWFFYLLGRHLIIEGVFWGLLFLWMRRRGDRGAQEALRVVVRFVRERVKMGYARLSALGKRRDA